jgi:hypothetical protein
MSVPAPPNRALSADPVELDGSDSGVPAGPSRLPTSESDPQSGNWAAGPDASGARVIRNFEAPIPTHSGLVPRYTTAES